MGVTKHAKSNSLLVTNQQGSESLGVLVTAFIWNVSQQDSFLTFGL